VELGHVTNAEEEDKLKSGSYKGRLAGAIFAGITSFALPGALAEQDRVSSTEAVPTRAGATDPPESAAASAGDDDAPGGSGADPEE